MRLLLTLQGDFDVFLFLGFVERLVGTVLNRVRTEIGEEDFLIDEIPIENRRCLRCDLRSRRSFW